MSDTDELDEAILDIAHKAGQIPRGKTIGAHNFPEAKAKLQQWKDREVAKALAGELLDLQAKWFTAPNGVITIGNKNGRPSIAEDVENRIQELSAQQEGKVQR